MKNALDKTIFQDVNLISLTMAAWVFDIAAWSCIISLYYIWFIVPFYAQAPMISIPVAIALRVIFGGLVNKPTLRKDMPPEQAINNSFLTSFCDLVFSVGLAVLLHLLEKI